MAFHSFLGKSIVLIFFASVFFGLVSAGGSPTQDHSSDQKCQYYPRQCKKILVRKEWYKLSEKEQQNYLNAVLCLSKKKTLRALHEKYAGTVNRLDDFTAVHSNQSPYMHFVGHFLHWHRYFGSVLENALRKECSYTGALPYWNTAKDLAKGGDMNRWGIFSNGTGFGGNGPYVSHVGVPNPYNVTGPTGGGCVKGGRFGTDNNFKANLGPTTNTSVTNPRCLMRDFTPSALAFCEQSNVNALLSQKDYSNFSRNLDGIPGLHGNGHLGIAGQIGQMCDLFNSPSDPIFYLHHANLDRIWWQWQEQDPSKRLHEIGGPTIPFDYPLQQGPAVTCDFEVNIDLMGPSIPVRDLLDTRSSPWCYEYDLSS